MEKNMVKFGLQVIKARESFMKKRKHCLKLRIYRPALMATFREELYDAGISEMIYQNGSRLTVRRGNCQVGLEAITNRDSYHVRTKALYKLESEVLDGDLSLGVLLIFGATNVESVMVYRTGPYGVFLPSSFTMSGFPGVVWG